MILDGINYDPHSFYCQKFWTSHFNVMFSMSISSQTFAHQNTFSLSDKIRACFCMLWPYFGKVYDVHWIIL